MMQESKTMNFLVEFSATGAVFLIEVLMEEIVLVVVQN